MADGAPLGVFGGTFDPIHYGHLRLAEEATEGLALSGVRFVPAGRPPHREGPGVSAADRLAMVRLATAGNPAFSLDAGEVESAEPSYTVPTLERLRAELGGARPIVLLLGADAFSALPTWHRWQELLELAHIVVAHRAGRPPEAAELPAELVQACVARHATDPAALRELPAGRVLALPMTPLAISATELRARLATGRSVRYLLPPEVLDYIRSRRLYA
jgi:nicotinate-nucleotide adenylyltransferase